MTGVWHLRDSPGYDTAATGERQFAAANLPARKLPACPAPTPSTPLIAITSVQGPGAASPLVGGTVAVRGIVTADWRGSERLNGFFVQQPDADNDRKVSGHASGRYPSTLDKVTRNVHGIDAAIRSVPGMNGVRERFEPQMLLVFCVAESLRFDRIAVVLDQIIRAGMGRGEQHHSPTLETGPLYALFKNWGSASAAVWRAVSAQARAQGTLSRSQLTRAQREHTEAVALLPSDTRWRGAALAVRVIKPPSA